MYLLYVVLVPKLDVFLMIQIVVWFDSTKWYWYIAYYFVYTLSKFMFENSRNDLRLLKSFARLALWPKVPSRQPQKFQVWIDLRIAGQSHQAGHHGHRGGTRDLGIGRQDMIFVGWFWPKRNKKLTWFGQMLICSCSDPWWAFVQRHFRLCAIIFNSKPLV